MIILDATNRSLEIDLTSVITTNQLPFMACWVDHTTSAYTPGSTLGQTNSTTAVTIVAAPGASTQRSIKYINIKNNDTVAAEVTIQYNDNTTLRELIQVTLAAEDTLQYVDTEGWSVINTSGQKKSIVSATITAALPAGTNNIGDVDVLSLPSLPAGTNNIGDIDVLTLPALPAGTNNIGDVDIASIAAGDNNIGNVDVVTLPAITGTVTANAGTNLNTSALALETTLDTRTGSLTETAPGTDTASSGLNGRLQRIAQRLTSLIALLPAALVSGRLDVNIGAAPASLTIGTFPDNEPFNVAQINGVTPLMGTGNSGTGAQRVVIATDQPAFTNPVPLVGSIAHDSADSGAPVKVGYKALSFATTPTPVAANDRTDSYANRHGIPFILGGHPNILTLEAAYTAAQTDTAIITVGANVKIVVTQIQVIADNANTVDVGVRIGFGATTTPTTTGVVLTHPGIAAGSGVSRGDGSGILGVGAGNEDLRITSEVPTTGSIRVLVSYFTIDET